MNKKQAYQPLADYIQMVVPVALQRGLLKSDYGWLARFGELLGDADRANVWSWVYVNSGIPLNRAAQIADLNKRLAIKMDDTAFQKLFAERERSSYKEASPFKRLLHDIEQRRGDALAGSALRKLIADYVGVNLRTLYRYEEFGVIPDRRKPMLKDAIISLRLPVRSEMMEEVFG